MITDTVTQQFKQQVCDEIRLLEEGKNRFRVFTPFRFDDGDHFPYSNLKSGVIILNLLLFFKTKTY